MNFLGKHVPYTIALCAFLWIAGPNFVNALVSYGTLRSETGSLAGIGYAFSGLEEVVLTSAAMTGFLLLRIRNAGYNAWFSLLGFIPFVNIATFIAAIFLPER